MKSKRFQNGGEVYILRLHWESQRKHSNLEREMLGNDQSLPSSPPNFNEYLEMQYHSYDKPKRIQWYSAAENQSWDAYRSLGMRAYHRLITILENSHKRAQGLRQENTDYSVRKKTVDLFRVRLLEEGGNEFTAINNTEFAQKFHPTKPPKGMSTEDFEVIKRFINDPNYLDTPENLRKLFNTLCYEESKLDGNSQYHMALIFGNGILINHGIVDFWGRINGKEEGGYHPQQYLLGAIATMPNKELLQDMIRVSSTGGSFAHPVLDSRGVARWPRDDKG